jgi:quinol monooxygenase YgiN
MFSMHVVVRKYATAPSYVEQVRPKLAHLEETMRALPGFVAYYFVETEDGLTTITVTEDETGTAKSMGR